MKNRYKHIFYTLCMFSMLLKSMEITPEILIAYKDQVDPFFDARRSDLDNLNSPWRLKRHGAEFVCWTIGIDSDEARSFLGRAFQNEDDLRRAAHAIIDGADAESMEYLRTLMEPLEHHVVHKKDVPHLTRKLKEVPHPVFESVATPWIEEHFPDHGKFRRGAACSLIAQLLLTSEGPAKQRHHHHHHKHHSSSD